MLTLGHVLTGRELTSLQQQAERHMAFSLTEACPLRCAHCIVSTVPVRDGERVTLSVERARRSAEQFGTLREMGVERISFTGGEPLLARAPLAILSQAAADAGIRTTVVTACHWAKTDATAEATVAEFPHIDGWHLSTDRFHAEFLSVDFVVRAARAARGAGRRVMVRMAVAHPVGDEDIHFVAKVQEMLPEDVPMALQPVSKVGRAESLDLVVPTGNRAHVPCMSTGPVVRHDGSVSPCCSSLIDWRDRHPFQFEDAFAAGLGATYEAWRANPLLQLVRSVGFEPLLGWVREEMPDHPIARNPPDHPCDICVGLWREPGTADVVRRRAQLPEVTSKIEQLYQIVLGPRPARSGQRSEEAP